jgi:glucosyl-dolichyl phosphate glucuronosyltransferase
VTLSSSIVICTKDREADLARCLDSLLGQTRLPDELVVVDGGSDDAETQVARFREAVPACRVHYLRSEPGLTRQRNAGIRAATGDIVHFLDDDVILDAPYVEAIQGTYEAAGADDVVGVSPLLRLDRTPSRLGTWYRRFFMLPRVNGSGRMLPSGYGTLTWHSGFEEVHPLEVACGCCTYRRDVLEQVQFDEYFAGYGYMEDHDFSYRAGKLGKLLGNPGATMLHNESPAARDRLRDLAAMQIRNHHYVFSKNLPQDFRHRVCFWWSELGHCLLRFAQAAKTLNPGIIVGACEGLAAIVGRGVRSTERERSQ